MGPTSPSAFAIVRTLCTAIQAQRGQVSDSGCALLPGVKRDVRPLRHVDALLGTTWPGTTTSLVTRSPFARLFGSQVFHVDSDDSQVLCGTHSSTIGSQAGHVSTVGSQAQCVTHGSIVRGVHVVCTVGRMRENRRLHREYVARGSSTSPGVIPPSVRTSV